jgi:ubiquinone/menaquinone biosynthesis C-methylase UbiE
MADGRFLPALRFAALTRFYDPTIRLTTREQTFKRLLIEQAAVGERDRVLDLGCGTGTLAIMAKHASPGAGIWGLDADPEMLERGVRKASQAGLEIRFDQGLSNQLPYPDATFDRVLSTLFFHHLRPEDKRLTIAEVARVLKPGGELHVADWGLPSGPLMRLLSLQIRFGDGDEPTRENLTGRLPGVFAAGGLTDVVETDRLRTPFGTLALHRARRSAA